MFSYHSLLAGSYGVLYLMRLIKANLLLSLFQFFFFFYLSYQFYKSWRYSKKGECVSPKTLIFFCIAGSLS